MLIYNTTYHVEEGEDKNFLIWMQEHYLPEVEKNGTLYAPRIARILSHIEEGSICYSVQFEVENSAKTASLASRARSETERGITEYL